MQNHSKVMRTVNKRPIAVTVNKEIRKSYHSKVSMHKKLIRNKMV